MMRARALRVLQEDIALEAGGVRLVGNYSAQGVHDVVKDDLAENDVQHRELSAEAHSVSSLEMNPWS